MSIEKRYTAKVDLREVNDTHALALGRVPARSTVLDLGAADGSMAAILREMGCRVWGVEIDERAAKLAQQFCEEVIVADLNSIDIPERIPNKSFDAILMLDVLEHVQDPVGLLRRVSSVLDDGGWAVISLPNVAHLSLRLSLMEGRFRYTETGLLDRTHLRFFDRAGLDELLEEAGWEMFELARVTRRFGTTEIQIDDADPAIVSELEQDIEALTYQFVLCAAPKGSPVLKNVPTLPAAEAQDELLRARERIAELDAEVAALQREHLPDLWLQLAEIRSSSTVRRQHLKHLLVTVRENVDRLSE